jgi:hypothetical protein
MKKWEPTLPRWLAGSAVQSNKGRRRQVRASGFPGFYILRFLRLRGALSKPHKVISGKLLEDFVGFSPELVE